MREKLFVLTLLMLISVSAATATFSTELIVVEDIILPGEAAQYEVIITNLGETADRYTLQSPEYSYILFIDDRPTSPIQPGESGTYVIELTPRNFVNYGSHRVPLDIRSQESGDEVTIGPILGIRDPSSNTGVYAPSVALSVGAPDSLDPREDLKLSIGLRNRNARGYTQEELTIRIVSEFFTEEYQTSLGGVNDNGEKTTERTIQIEDVQSPGEYPLTVQVIIEDKVISEYTGTFEVAGYQEIRRDSAQDQLLFKTVTTYSVLNEGNTEQTVEVTHPVGVFKQIFSSVSEKYTIEKVDGERLAVVSLELISQEEASVTYTHNYRLLVLLIILAIGSVIGYYILRSPVVLDKEGDFSGNVDENTSELKVRLFIKNRSAQTLRNVRIVDRVSGLADVVKDTGLGTLTPTKIVKKKSQGTLIRWDIESLEPFEERIVSYKVHTPLALVGDITLPSLKVTFEQDSGRQRTSHSNDVSIRRSD